MPNFTEQQKTDIYQKFYVKVFGYMQNHVRNVHLAEDLSGAVFAKVFEKLDTFDQTKSSLSTWIYTITSRTLIDYYKTRKVTSEMPEDIADQSIGADSELCKTETLDELADALKKLDERMRTLVILRYYHGYTFVEIAKRMRISYAYVKVLHIKALAQLKKLL